MAVQFSYVIAVGAVGKTGSLEVTVNSDVPYYLCNMQNCKVKGTGNGGAEATVVIIQPGGERILFPLDQIATIGGAVPSSLTDAVNKLAVLIIE